MKESYGGKGSREALARLLSDRTKALDRKDLTPVCAQNLAETLAMSRNLASQYLNEMVAEGVAVKAGTRPVYFFDRQELFSPFRQVAEESVFPSAEALWARLDKLGKKSAFDSLVGSQGSLAHCVEQCKASITYPGGGLPLLLYGPTGTGKTLIAQLMYDYGKEKGVLGEKSRFVHLNCSEYANNPELFLTNFFGHTKGAYTGADKNRDGLVRLADGGVLFLDEVHCLKAECQEKLFQFMDKGTYHMVGDNDSWYHSGARLLFATTEDPESSLLRTLLRRIPILVKVPALSERAMGERRLLIHFILQKEQERVKRPVFISKLAYRALLQFSFPGNAGQLINTLQAGLAKAMLHLETGELRLHLSHLPEELIQEGVALLNGESVAQEGFLSLEDLGQGTEESNHLHTLHGDLARAYVQYVHKEDGAKELWEKSDGLIHKYIDHLYFSQDRRFDPGQKLAASLLENFYGQLAQRRNLPKANGQEIDAMARLVSDLQSASMDKEEAESMAAVGQLLKSAFPGDWSVAMEIGRFVQRAFAQPGSALFQAYEALALDLFLLLRHFHKQVSRDMVPCVVVAHGRSTASSIAQAVNHILGGHLFNAVDMPVDCAPEKVVEEISGFFRQMEGYAEAVIMVDMGSLEYLSERIEIPLGMSLGFVNNVTTKLALDIGSSLLQGKKVEESLEAACGRNGFTYTYISNMPKRDVVLTVCSTGMVTAEKIAGLIRDSLPKQTGLTILPYDFKTLHSLGLSAPVFQRDRVKLIVGTMDPGIADLPYVPLEKLIAQEADFGIAQLLSEHLSPQEARQFDENLVKQFSLMNLLDHLTILNPEKIFSHVQNIVAKLQRELGVTFGNGVIVGLYVHLSCLIERLITDRYIGDYPDEERLRAEHADFIALIQRCFQEIEAHYSVTIPISEVGYLFEYVNYAVGESVSKKEVLASNEVL